MSDLLSFSDQPLASLLSDETMGRLAEAASRIRYENGRLIHARGDDKPGFSIVVEGAVRFVKRLSAGGELTISTLGPGHSFGEATLFAGAGRAYDAVAIGDTVVDQISKPAFERILSDDPSLARALLTATTRRLYAALGFLDDQRSLPLDVRVAKLITAMAEASKNPKRIDCRQSDLAYTLGVSRVTVGKALGVLQADGLIELGYGEIRLPKGGALTHWIAEREA